MMVTHDELVEIAKVWLWKRCNIVITEIATGGEEPDAIGWYGRHNSILIECKTSISDFKADAKKIWRQYEGSGMGRERYYLTSKGLLSKEELPKGWGLIEYDGQKTRAVLKSGIFLNRNMNSEQSILTSTLKRIGVAAKEITGCSVKFYTYETKNRATVGINIDEDL